MALSAEMVMMKGKKRDNNYKSAVTYYRIKVTDAELTDKNRKYVCLMVEVVSVAVNVVAEVVRSTYRTSN